MLSKTATYTITSILPQKKNRERVNIYLNGDFWKGLDLELVAALGLRKNKTFDPNDLEKIVFKEEKKKALSKALKLLEYRARSQEEISNRLRRADYSQDVIRAVIKDLSALGYLDDEAFVEMWIKDRIIKGCGQWRISSELMAKGVRRELIEEKISEHYSDQERYARAFEVGKKKVVTLKQVDKNKRYKNLSGYLLRRGFSSHLVAEVCEKLLSQENM